MTNCTVNVEILHSTTFHRMTARCAEGKEGTDTAATSIHKKETTSAAVSVPSPSLTKIYSHSDEGGIFRKNSAICHTPRKAALVPVIAMTARYEAGRSNPEAYKTVANKEIPAFAGMTALLKKKSRPRKSGFSQTKNMKKFKTILLP